ncbi:MAG: 3-oxoacyl-ACP reductase FabG [Methyloprofundus sp.]|nr:3-oxoacyl-ACP reductase FabG [Methyloprofundus sp.]
MKRALITGGSGDIGAALCYKLAANNIHVIVHSHHNYAKASQIVENIQQQGGSAETVSFDVCDADATEQALATLSAAGTIQIIINNAGIHQDAPLAGMSREKWHQVIDVSLHGFYNVTQPLLMPMMQTRWGRIINMSSVAAVMGNRGQTNYAAAKAALHGATKSLAQELASRKVTVNAIAPGIIAGQMTDNSFDKQMIKNIVPMQRAGTPEEVASLAYFLCSDEASYISGQIININGAMA